MSDAAVKLFWLMLFCAIAAVGVVHGSRQQRTTESQARAQWAQVYWARRAFYVEKEVIREKWELWDKGVHMWNCPVSPGCACAEKKGE